MHANNNIYQNRNGIETRSGWGSSRVRNYISSSFFSIGRNANNVFSDRQGNVYQRGNQGQWQQRTNWPKTSLYTHSPEITRNLDRQQQMRTSGQSRAQNFQNAAHFSPGTFGGFHSAALGGGGGFHAGGGGFHGGGGRR
jgi:hypothetical protein